MTQTNWRGRALILATIALWAGCDGALAQAWPNKQLRIIVPFVPGGAVDSFTRVLADKLQSQLKVPVVVEDHAGAGGNVGANFVAKSPPDGATFLLSTNGQAVSPAIFKSLPYDPLVDLARVARLATTSTVLVVKNNFPPRDFQQFVAYAKARPGKLSYGSSGVGNNLHLTMEMIKHETGVDMQMVPYGGDAPLYTALIGGDIQAAVVPTTSARPFLVTGDIRAIGVTTAQRVSILPDIPTLQEQGLTGFSVTGWLALFAPGATPRPAIDAAATATRAALDTPELKEAMKNLVLDPGFAGPDEFDKVYRADVERFRKIVKDANIPLQE